MTATSPIFRGMFRCGSWTFPRQGVNNRSAPSEAHLLLVEYERALFDRNRVSLAAHASCFSLFSKSIAL